MEQDRPLVAVTGGGGFIGYASEPGAACPRDRVRIIGSLYWPVRRTLNGLVAAGAELSRRCCRMSRFDHAKRAGRPDGRLPPIYVEIDRPSPVNREELARALRVRGVGTGVYYPKPVFDYACYREHPGVIESDSVPHAFDLSRQVLSLPVHPGADRRRT